MYIYLYLYKCIYKVVILNSHFWIRFDILSLSIYYLHYYSNYQRNRLKKHHISLFIIEELYYYGLYCGSGTAKTIFSSCHFHHYEHQLQNEREMAVNFHVFTIFTTRKPIISNPCPKFLWTSSYMVCDKFARYQINYIFRPAI